MQSTSLSRHASQVLTVARGAKSDAVSDPSIARSWLRCLDDYHLDPAVLQDPVVLEQAGLRERRERLQQVLDIASGELNSLHQQLAGAGHAVLLTDARGIILECVTAPAERRVFERAGLWLGADWSEAREGTNGIGTCLVERQPLTIHQDEHFRGRHTGLTCSASPVFDPHGDLLAVLDVSSAKAQVSRQSQFHTMSLVNLSARMIESCYFLRQYAHQWLLRFHPRAESVGLFSEGLLAFDEEGRVCAANQSALNLLAISREALLGQALTHWFRCDPQMLIQRAMPQGSTVWPLHTRDGRSLFASVRGPAVARPQGVAPPVQVVGEGLCLLDAGLREQFRRALRVFERDVPLLLQGETGVGKEAFAKAIHQASTRRQAPFVAINCASLPESLIESELFGYRGGSFTGARKDGMPGKLLQADGGTVLLDEIGDMPLALQTRLLRVLEERQVVPIGGQAQALDVRIVSATHRDLLEQVAQGSFREDLYYRLAGLEVELPAVRERTDTAHLLEVLLAQEAGDRPVRLEATARQRLLAFAWPGNVRQLRNVLRTLVALCDDGLIRFEDLPAAIRRSGVAEASPPVTSNCLEDAERAALLSTLEAHRWHMTRVAEQLGISRNTLYRKLRRHGIERRR
ncbi:sigma-54-dependent Fis family transcriptional regulator [Pseudomonas monteilii]|uniref:sigma-54-dependent Fis family transcriptional regulator n=1 Tax=Pseudomonas alabamensis TaxID=3064349 RepID=UPI0027142BCE|nr:sigma-54-dependent Fis family transcriptional regulator [Pseudomonas sp. 22-AL-CL-001]MDO7909919.1 sigma-54-dependent Fis family transcriptional regulator [Pseudomonas sp. 22-AL-CL-001]